MATVAVSSSENDGRSHPGHVQLAHRRQEVLADRLALGLGLPLGLTSDGVVGREVADALALDRAFLVTV
jgi:hypothetical protein